MARAHLADPVRDANLRVATVARRQLRTQLTAVRSELSAGIAQGSCSAERIHTVRVACRRALASLSLFRDLVPDRSRRWFRTRLRRVLGTAAPTRDCDILLDHLVGERRSRRGGRNAARLVTLVSARRDVAERAVLRLADRIVRGGWSTRVRRLSLGMMADAEPSPSARLVRRRLKRRVASFIDDSRRTPSGTGSLHRLRIRAKKLRYAVESLAERVPDATDASCLVSLRHLQGVLGEASDHATAVDTIRHLQALPGPGHGASAWIRFRRGERRLATRARRVFSRWWTRDQRRTLRRRCRLMLREAVG